MTPMILSIYVSYVSHVSYVIPLSNFGSNHMTALCKLFQRVIRVGRLSPPVFHPTMPLALRVANDEKFAIAVRQTRPVRHVDGSGTAAPPLPRFLIWMIRGPFTMGELDSFDNNNGFDAQVYSAAASASGGAADSASGGAAEPAAESNVKIP